MAIGGFKQYDASQVDIVINGILINSGFASGEFLTLKQSAPDYKKYVGADGEVTRSRTNDRSGEMEVKLAQTSSGNSFLTALSNADILSKNGAGVGALLIRDKLSGACIYTAGKCWIAKPPDVTFDADTTPRTWMLEFADLTRVDAGS
jgi:hypothetical protein